MMLYTFDDEMGNLEFTEDAFDGLMDKTDGKEQLTSLLNFVKFNTSITDALNGLIDADIVKVTDESGNPSNADELKQDVANNKLVFDFLANKYNLTLWTDAEIGEMAKDGLEKQRE